MALVTWDQLTDKPGSRSIKLFCTLFINTICYLRSELPLGFSNMRKTVRNFFLIYVKCIKKCVQPWTYHRGTSMVQLLRNFVCQGKTAIARYQKLIQKSMNKVLNKLAVNNFISASFSLSFCSVLFHGNGINFFSLFLVH